MAFNLAVQFTRYEAVSIQTFFGDQHQPQWMTTCIQLVPMPESYALTEAAGRLPLLLTAC